MASTCCLAPGSTFRSVLAMLTGCSAPFRRPERVLACCWLEFSAVISLLDLT
jgi:hypothetical protein